MDRRLAVHLDLVETRSCLFSRWLLDALVIFPFANALRRSATRPLFSFAGSSVCSVLCIRWWRRTACDLRRHRVGVVLVRRPWESATRSRRSVVHERSNLGTWARLPGVWRHRSLTCRCLHGIRRRRHTGRRTEWRCSLHRRLRRTLVRTIRCVRRRLVERCRLVRSGVLVLGRR